MANLSRKLMFCGAVLSLLRATGLHAGNVHGIPTNIRIGSARISEIFEYALKRSASFGDLLATLETVDRVVYVDEGTCHHGELRSCLQLMPTLGGRNILVRFDPRQPIRLAVMQLAHELYHALEVAREPDVVSEAGLRAFYERIGERSCANAFDDCFETRGAVAFEALVNRQLGASRNQPPTHRLESDTRDGPMGNGFRR